jgi:hypothetical protein
MAQKKALTNEELLAQFEGIGSTDAAPPAPSSTPSKSSSKPSKQAALQNDPLAELSELENLAKAKPLSRPNTPKLGVNRTRSPIRRDAHTPPSSGSGRNSEDKPRALALPRKSGESARSFHQGLTPAPEEPADENRAPEPEQQQQQGGGWWGGIFATASAAVKQAEAAVKEIQQNEEAQKWAQQVRGNVGALRGLGKER